MTGRELGFADSDALASATAELESFGVRTMWVPAWDGTTLPPLASKILRASQQMCLASAIMNVWKTPARSAAAVFADIESVAPRRFVLALGVSHAVLVDGIDGRYEKPLTKIRSYLDELEDLDPGVPARDIMLAALGPNMLSLSSQRTRGAYAYLVDPEYTRRARAAVGAATLAVEQKVLLVEDPALARESARFHLAPYLRLPNYLANLRRMGFGPDDLAGTGSDRLVDALIAWGTPEQAWARIREHLDAGADHIAVQVLRPGNHLSADLAAGLDDAATLPVEEWRLLFADHHPFLLDKQVLTI